MENSLVEQLSKLREVFLQELTTADDPLKLQNLKVKFLGKKGGLTEILRGMAALRPDEKREVGAKANELKVFIETTFDQKFQEISEIQLQNSLSKDGFDISLPGIAPIAGGLHPITQILSEIENIFMSMGFQVHQGPQIETEYYNFTALNIPENHPARDMQDTLYLKDFGKLLRTHTSPVQIHVMETEKPPIAIIAPGAVYRNDYDMTHTPMFHQVEGLMVAEGVSFAHLKAVLSLFVQKIFGENTKARFRPSFFPFTEPSAEMDIGCVFCKGAGCRVCKQTGFLEILGCGMVDPAVLAHVKIDSEKFSGFAFGMGVERIAMLKLGVNDIRMFFENDMRFLRQF